MIKWQTHTATARAAFLLSPNRHLATLALAGVLTACAVGPDYEQPATPAPDQFAEAAHPEFSSNSIDAEWWKLFKDAQLVALVDEAIRHNHDLEAARATLREARALYLEAGYDLIPTITSHANYTNQQRSVASLNNRAFVPRGLELYNIGFDAFWELDLFGRVRRNVEASSDEVEQQEATLRDVGVSLIAEVARNYFELRGLQHQMVVAKGNVKNQQQTFDITQVRLENGRGTELDTSRAKAQLESAKATIPPLETAISAAIHRLGVLTGQLPGTLTAELSKAVPIPQLPELIPVGSPTELFRRRPDVRIAERRLAASTARIGVATAELFPKVTFVGNISLESSMLSGIGAAGSQAYMFGPRISWPALDLGRVYARLKAADAHAEADLAFYQQTVLNVLEETENALVAYNKARAQQALIASSVEANRKAHHLAHLRFDEGVSDFLTLLDVELRYLVDQNQLAQSQTDTATALVAVYKALGGGWEARDE